MTWVEMSDRNRPSPRGAVLCTLLAAGLGLCPACYTSFEILSTEGPTTDTGPAGDNGDGDGDAGDNGDVSTCAPAGRLVSGAKIEAVDLLFVVDDSQSMLPVQGALRDQFPRLIEMLSSGEVFDANDNLIKIFRPVTDLHVGVVSTDMGLSGIDGIPNCLNGLGGDGRLQHAPSPNVMGCDDSYPKFLSFVEDDDPAATARSLGCIATLGTDGCGFEQQLEAALKALWPALDIDPATGLQWSDPNTGEPGNRVTFLPDLDGNGLTGHGDGDNAGFLRNDVDAGLSLIGVVIVTDEEDCSSSSTEHFTPDPFLPDDHELKGQPINLRCFYNRDRLYSIDRYINGLKALRPGQESLVAFTAIAGIPVDLVDDREAAFAQPQGRDGWYARVLSDGRMIERVDETEPDIAKRKLVPSCQNASTTAMPPRRLVQVAQAFGENGTVASICGDLSVAMDSVVAALSSPLSYRCLAEAPMLDAEGNADCEVVWELPTQHVAARDAPVTCDDLEYLSSPAPGEATVGSGGGNLCLVQQIPVHPDDRATARNATVQIDRARIILGVADAGEGWYYDDFSFDPLTVCLTGEAQRITFTLDAAPPPGVNVLLECPPQSDGCR